MRINVKHERFSTRTSNERILEVDEVEKMEEDGDEYLLIDGICYITETDTLTLYHQILKHGYADLSKYKIKKEKVKGY